MQEGVAQVREMRLALHSSLQAEPPCARACSPLGCARAAPRSDRVRVFAMDQGEKEHVMPDALKRKDESGHVEASNLLGQDVHQFQN